MPQHPELEEKLLLLYSSERKAFFAGGIYCESATQRGEGCHARSHG